MTNVKIVCIIPDQITLLSVVDEETGDPEFRQIFERWSDIDYLYDFFERNRSDVSGITIETAIKRVTHDASELEEKLLTIAESDLDQLQSMFKPLNPGDYRLLEFQKSKAYGTIRKSWLRIYAIRINAETYIITGGAIKLTRTMQERPHTNDQLKRLTQVRDYLIREGFDETDIEEIEIDP